MKFVPKHYSIISDIIYFIKHFQRYEPVVLFLCGVEIILGAATPLAGIYLPKAAIDLVVQGASVQKAVMVLVPFTLLIMAVYTLKTAVSSGKYNYYNSQRDYFMGLLFLKSLKVPYKYTESGEMKKVYWKAYDAISMGDWSALSRMVTGTTNITINILRFLLYSTVIGTLDAWLLLVLDVLAIASYLLDLCQIRYEESLRDEIAEATKKYYCVLDSMGNTKGAKDIRIFGMGHWLAGLRDMVIEKQRGINQKLYKKRSRFEKAGFLLGMVRDMGAYTFLLYKAFEGAIDAGGFVLYFGAITGFSGFITSIMNSLSELRSAANAADYLRAYMEIPGEDDSSGKRHIDGLELPLKIEFKNVSFSYDGKNEILHDVSFVVNPGETLGIVGHTGSGKSSIINVMMRFYEFGSGEVLIDGIDIRKFPKKELRKKLGLVLQEPFMFYGDISSNIRLYNDKITDQQIKDAAQTVQADSFIEKMPGKYHAKVIEGGSELSQGQRQLISFARTLVTDPKILVLDEATANVDTETENLIQEGLKKLCQGRTTLAIAHRLSTIADADQIIVLDKGRIVERGTHEELLKKKGYYYNLYKLQQNSDK